MEVPARLLRHLKKLKPAEYKAVRKATVLLMQELIELGPEFRTIEIADLLRAIYKIEKL